MDSAAYYWPKSLDMPVDSYASLVETLVVYVWLSVAEPYEQLLSDSYFNSLSL